LSGADCPIAVLAFAAVCLGGIESTFCAADEVLQQAVGRWPCPGGVEGFESAGGRHVCCSVSNSQRAACGHPGEVLVEEVAFGIFFEGDGGESGRVFPPVFVLRDVGDHGDGGRRFTDELVRK
jgi:hypothetical protein